MKLYGRRAAPGPGGGMSRLASALTLTMGLTAGLRADIVIPTRFADAAPVVDGIVAEGEWDFSAITTLRAGEVVLYSKNDDRFLYLLLDARSDTSNEIPDYHLVVDANRDGQINDYHDFSYRVGLSVAGQTPPLLTKWPFEPLLPGPTVPTILSTAPDSHAAIGFQTTWMLGWLGLAHRVVEFRLSLAELGVRPETLRMPTAGLPAVRLRVKYSPLDKPYEDLDEPGSAGGAAGFDNMFLMQLSLNAAYPPGTTGPIFQGVGRVPSGAIDDALGTVYLNIPGYDYIVNNDAPFGGVLQIRVDFLSARLVGAARYRVLMSRDGGSESVLRQRWTNLRLPTEEAVLFQADSSGWYRVAPDIASATAWFKPNLAMEWSTADFPDGTYRLRLEVDDPFGPIDLGPGNSLTLRVVNTPPSARITNIRYDGADVCECGIVTQGDSPRGFTFTVAVTDPGGALGSFSFGGTSGFGVPAENLAYSDGYARGREENRQWHGVTDLVIHATNPWRAPRPCAYAFTLSASSRVQDGFRTLYSDQAVASLTILTNRGPGRTDCTGTVEPEAPQLAVRVDGGTVTITWPAEFSDYRLQFTRFPEDPFSWADWKEPVVVVGDRRFTAFPQGSRPAEFYRLRRVP